MVFICNVWDGFACAFRREYRMYGVVSVYAIHDMNTNEMVRANNDDEEKERRNFFAILKWLVPIALIAIGAGAIVLDRE